jgi:hypothetical protein
MKKYVILNTTTGSKKEIVGIRDLSRFFGVTPMRAMRFLRGNNAYAWGNDIIAGEGVNISKLDYSVNKTAVISNALPTKVVIAFAKVLNTAIVPAVGRFAISGKTIDSLTVGNSTVTLTVTEAFVFGDIVAVSYSKGALPLTYKEDGSNVLSFSNLPVTNNVAEA